MVQLLLIAGANMNSKDNVQNMRVCLFHRICVCVVCVFVCVCLCDYFTSKALWLSSFRYMENSIHAGDLGEAVVWDGEEVLL